MKSPKHSRFTNEGNIVMNFDNENIRAEAAQKLESVEQISTKSVGKMKLMIMICNVHREETKGKKKETILDHNEFLHTIEGVENKIELIFSKPAAGGTMHYILRCDPTVRELI